MLRNYYSENERNVASIELGDDFFYLLYDRLSLCVENALFSGDDLFTLFINIIERRESKPTYRNKYNLNETPRFIYGGSKRQLELLDDRSWDRWKKPPSNAEVQEAIRYLEEEAIVEQKDSKVSSGFYQKVVDGSYGLKDAAEIGYLAKYFSHTIEAHEDERIREKIILEYYFDIKSDCYVSLPLIGFGEIDGIVHIVFKKELLAKVAGSQEQTHRLPEQIVEALIIAFVTEYDDLFLIWDTIGDSAEKTDTIEYFIGDVVLNTDDYFNRTKKPKIFKEIKLRSYYLRFRPYFQKRIQLGEAVPGKFYQEYLINAINAILIDSYAHNVSAHALSTLAWWYYRRGQELGDQELPWTKVLDYLKQDDHLDKKLIDQFETDLYDREQKREKERETRRKSSVNVESRPKYTTRKEEATAEDGGAVIHYPGSLSREMASLLRFLMEKGAYWSGVNRDINIGGKISSLYTILWYELLRNPLYLGTIAKTEDIMHIKLRVVIYEPYESNEAHERLPYHQKTYRPENSGVLGSVNLLEPRAQFLEPDDDPIHEEVLSRFVNRGDDFKHLREQLKKIRIYFPGGVVGQHAFLTMIENEIRNVKHYSQQSLREMKEQGLTVAVGVQARSLIGSTGQELYRMTVWLDHPTRLIKPENPSPQEIATQHLIVTKWNDLSGDIIKDKQARLGGTFQDKVCASFLLNNQFSAVQRGDTSATRDKQRDKDRDRRYYPWIRPTCSREEKDEKSGEHIDFKISKPQQTTEVDPTTQEITVTLQLAEDIPLYGYVKKTFYVWRGEKLWQPKTGERTVDRRPIKIDGEYKEWKESEWENPSRFKLVQIDNLDKNLIEMRRERGLLRVVEGPVAGEFPDAHYQAAYKQWLLHLLGEGQLHPLVFKEGGSPRFYLALDGRGTVPTLYYSKTGRDLPNGLWDEIDDHLETTAGREQSQIELIHKGEEAQTSFVNALRYRNHGILRSQFWRVDIQPALTDDNRMLELFEVMATRVCIIDNRMYQRLRLELGSAEEAEREALMRNKLKLTIHDERLPDPGEDTGGQPRLLYGMNEADIEFMKHCHFLVIHLSFIEKLMKEDPTIDRIPDDQIVVQFIKEKLLPIVGERPNFFLVVTTGRGRNEWWTALDALERDDKKPVYTDYRTFTLFRAIESLLSAAENSISMYDDIELKYRIVKILYGS